MATKSEHKEKDPLLEVARCDKRIENIHKKIEKERQNLLDSGFCEKDVMFWNLFSEIEAAYVNDLIPWLIRRHRLVPFTDAEIEELRQMHRLDLDFKNLPEGDQLKEYLAELRQASTKRKGR